MQPCTHTVGLLRGHRMTLVLLMVEFTVLVLMMVVVHCVMVFSEISVVLVHGVDQCNGVVVASVLCCWIIEASCTLHHDCQHNNTEQQVNSTMSNPRSCQQRQGHAVPTKERHSVGARLQLTTSAVVA